MSDPQARAAEVLAAHMPLGFRCECGWDSHQSATYATEHAAHVAAALAEAGLLADLETRRFGAIFDDLDAARAELAEVKAARDDDLEELVARFNLIQQAEAREAALRDGVRALADEWRTAHGDPPVDPSHISVRHAERLLALIGDQP